MKTYLLKDRKIYKIGQSKNPEKRFNQLRVGNPNIRMICFGNGISESDLHYKYRHKNISGEWFKLNKNDVEYIIKTIKNEFSGFQPKEKLAGNYILTFGKYKGATLHDINKNHGTNYIRWIANELNNDASYMAFKYLKSMKITRGIKKKKRKHRKFKENKNLNKAIIKHRVLDQEFNRKINDPFS